VISEAAPGLRLGDGYERPGVASYPACASCPYRTAPTFFPASVKGPSAPRKRGVTTTARFLRQQSNRNFNPGALSSGAQEHSLTMLFMVDGLTAGDVVKLRAPFHDLEEGDEGIVLDEKARQPGSVVVRFRVLPEPVEVPRATLARALP
jgi:hypothetical protein